MTPPLPVSLLVLLTLALLLCRPWLEARRPLDSLALFAGMGLGPVASLTAPLDAGSSLAPVAALAAGWVVLANAEPWGTRTLRGAGAARRLPLLVLPALAVGAAAAAVWSRSDRVTAAVIAGCAAIALDPDAARGALRLATRPGPAARMAPTIAGLALGLALILSAASIGQRAGRPLLAYPLGILTGLLLAGLLRITEGKGMTLALLVTAPIVGWGLARRLDLSPLATLLLMGAVLADDPKRRDLVFSTLREYERPFRIAMLVLAGVGLAASLEPLDSASVWATVALLVVARPLVWRLVPWTGLSLRQAIPISPLAVPLALLAGHHPVAMAVTVSWVLCEAASRLPDRLWRSAV